jgi:hypothetical protein
VTEIEKIEQELKNGKLSRADADLLIQVENEAFESELDEIGFFSNIN